MSGKLESIESIRHRVQVLRQQIGAPDGSVDFDRPRGDATPHIEIDHQYFFVVIERGEELRRDATTSVDELLFWIFESITFSMASKFEWEHRRRGEDSRRQLFSKQEELLAALSPAWAARQRLKYEDILQRHPFVDKQNR